MPAPTLDPYERDPATVSSTETYRRADRVWVYRDRAWCAGVVEASSPHAVTVTYRPEKSRGTGVDTITARYLLPRDEYDPLLDGPSR